MHIITVSLFVLHSVYWIEFCPPADQILPHLPAPHKRLSRSDLDTCETCYMRYLNQHTDANFQVKHHRNVKHRALLDSPASILMPVKYTHVPVSQRQQQRNELAINKADWASRGLRSTDQSPRQANQTLRFLLRLLSEQDKLFINSGLICNLH